MRHNTDGPESSWEEIATTFLEDPQSLHSSSRSEACFVVQAGGPIGKMVTVGHGITIGRNAEADLCIPDNGVSRIHLRAKRTPDGLVRIVDQGSRNGTFVNFSRVNSAVLENGDRIYIGTGAILRFCYADRLEEVFQRKLYDAALRDSLTGLYNRRHLMSQLETEVDLVNRHVTQLTAVLIDIDHFKMINDQHGHLIGDAVLQGLGEQLRISIRGSDFAARYGGEELVIVCRGAQAKSGVQLAKRLQQQLRERILVKDVPGLRVTFSAGVATAPHESVHNAEDLLRMADEALYRAKRSGRNRICLSK